MINIFCISQARMGSSRLPGKILKEIQGIPLLSYHATRVSHSKKITQHIIATTDLGQDQRIVDFCQQHKIAYYCGNESNVLSRYYHAASAYNAQPDDLIVRVTSDCPLIDSQLLDRLINLHIEKNLLGISNIDITSYPRGFDVEVFQMQALTNAYQQANTDFQKEHVTPYLYQHNHLYPSLSLKNQVKLDNALPLRLCVDEPDDFHLIESLISHYPENIMSANANAIIQFLNQHPEIAQINQHVLQKCH